MKSLKISLLLIVFTLFSNISFSQTESNGGKFTRWITDDCAGRGLVQYRYRIPKNTGSTTNPYTIYFQVRATSSQWNKISFKLKAGGKTKSFTKKLLNGKKIDGVRVYDYYMDIKRKDKPNFMFIELIDSKGSINLEC